MMRSLTEMQPKKKPSRLGFSDSILSKVATRKWEDDADIEDPEHVSRKVTVC
jgi:hypothetical protein